MPPSCTNTLIDPVPVPRDGLTVSHEPPVVVDASATQLMLEPCGATIPIVWLPIEPPAAPVKSSRAGEIVSCAGATDTDPRHQPAQYFSQSAASLDGLAGWPRRTPAPLQR